MARNVKILVLADVGDDPESPDFEPVGGQRSASLEESTDPIDLTTEDSDGYEEHDYGLNTWTVSCDGLYVPEAEGYKALKKSLREKRKVLLRIKEDGQETEEGLAIVESLEIEGEHDGESTYSVDFQGTGPLTEVSG